MFYVSNMPHNYLNIICYITGLFSYSFAHSIEPLTYDAAYAIVQAEEEAVVLLSFILHNHNYVIFSVDYLSCL